MLLLPLLDPATRSRHTGLASVCSPSLGHNSFCLFTSSSSSFFFVLIFLFPSPLHQRSHHLFFNIPLHTTVVIIHVYQVAAILIVVCYLQGTSAGISTLGDLEILFVLPISVGKPNAATP